jgi:hypothetical protein
VPSLFRSPSLLPSFWGTSTANNGHRVDC